MTSSRNAAVERALSQLLDALAALLIPLEITPARLAQVARFSFVKMSAITERMHSSGRPHLARIAARTGLSRAEVKRIVASNFRIVESSVESAPRALRVLEGWRTSKEYTFRGRPRSLRLKGAEPSFDSLCKQFSGDIPRKVILDELLASKRVTISRRRQIVSITQNSGYAPKGHLDHDALRFAASFLEDALRPDRIVVKRRDKVAASRDVSDVYVEKAISNRFSALLEQSPSLFIRRGAPKRHVLTAYTLVLRSRPNKNPKAGED